jgi:hypothetical protein
MVEWKYSSIVLNLDIKQRRMVIFMPLLLYSRERAPSNTAKEAE